MIAVQQIDLSSGTGDCLRASTASLFELDLNDVPNFMLADDWWESFNEFVWSIGYEVVRYVGSFDFIATKDGLLLAAIKSNYGKGLSHAVVIDIDGIVVHDPLPTRPNLGLDVTKGILEHWFLITKRST